jgi:O-antigen ligase
MVELIRAYKARPWPKLEIPSLGRTQLFMLIGYTAIMVAMGWYIFLNEPRAYKFLFIGAAIPILFLLKSPYFTIASLLAFQVVGAFLAVGSSSYIGTVILFMVISFVAFESPTITYLMIIVILWFANWLISFGLSTTANMVMCGAIIVGWIMREKIYSSSQPGKIRFPELVPALLLYLWILIGFSLWCLEPFPAGWEQLKTISVGISIFLISPLVINNEKRLNIVIVAWIIGAIGTSIGLSVATANPPTGLESGATGTEWLLAAKNVIANKLSYVFFLLIPCFYIVKRRLLKAAILFTIVLILIRILLLWSRGTMVALGTGFSLFWLIETFWGVKSKSVLRLATRLFTLLCIVAATIVIVYILDAAEALGPYAEIFTHQEASSTLEFRYNTWETVVDIINTERHLIRGSGLGAFWLLGPEHGYFLTDYQENMALASPHHLYLDIVLHYGLVGLVIYLVLAFLNLGRLWKMYLHPPNLKYRYLSIAMFCSMVGYYVHGFIDNQLYSSFDFWLYLGLVVSILNLGIAQQAQIGKENSADVVPVLPPGA